MGDIKLISFQNAELIIKSIKDHEIYVDDKTLEKRIELYKQGFTVKQILEMEKSSNE